MKGKIIIESVEEDEVNTVAEAEEWPGEARKEITVNGPHHGRNVGPDEAPPPLL